MLQGLHCGVCHAANAYVLGPLRSLVTVCLSTACAKQMLTGWLDLERAHVCNHTKLPWRPQAPGSQKPLCCKHSNTPEGSAPAAPCSSKQDPSMTPGDVLCPGALSCVGCVDCLSGASVQHVGCRVLQYGCCSKTLVPPEPYMAHIRACFPTVLT